VKIEILDEDLIEGFRFYENRESGLGSYFLDCLLSDIDWLILYAGIHRIVFGYHRLLSNASPLPFIISLKHDLTRVHAILDCRRNPTWSRNPTWIRKRLGKDK
jgi:hypothetical protein